MLEVELGSGFNTWRTGTKERFSREFMAIRPVVNGRHSSLAKVFPNLLFNNSFNVSIAKIKSSLRSFEKGRGGTNIFSSLNFSTLPVWGIHLHHTEYKITLRIGHLSNLRTVNIILLFFSYKPPALLAIKERRSINHHSRIMTGCLQEKKESN